MKLKRLLAVASLALSTTAAADTPRLLKNGRPACGNVPKKTAMDDEERACLRAARERAKREKEKEQQPEIVVDLSGLADRAQPQRRQVTKVAAARERVHRTHRR